MNLSNRLLLPMFLATLSTALPALAAPNLEEGNYEVTMKMEMEGMPFAMPPVKHNQCMTKKELVPDTSQKGQDCVVKDQKIVGDTLNWKVECNGKDGKTEGEGKITYAGKTYDGLMKMKMTQKGETMNMKMAFQGKHTGACKSPPGKKAGDY
jgi:hypothetical protein